MKKEMVSASDAQKEKTETGEATMGAADALRDGAGVPTIDDFSKEQKALIGAIVVDTLKEILPPIVEAQLLDLMAGDKVTISGPSIEDVIAGIRPDLPDLIATAISTNADAAAAQEKAAADDAAVSMREQTARDKARADKVAADRIKRRGQAIADHAARFAALFGPEGKSKGFPLSDLTGETPLLPKLLLDDGKTFCVDFINLIEPERLMEVDGMIRLTAKIDLPADMPGFPVKGVVLLIDEYRAMRCEIPTPLHVGDGRGAHLAADSLVFRAPAPIAA